MNGIVASERPRRKETYGVIRIVGMIMGEDGSTAMCGRFTLLEFEPTRMLTQVFGIEVSSRLASRYNIAPTQPVAVLRTSPEGVGRELVMLHWGLIPRWAKDPSVGNRMINARVETVAEKPAYRDAFRRRRCLVPASGFYEWKKEARRKQPYYICSRDGSPIAFAGLWERWEAEGSDAIESCVILTTASNELLKPIHDRMPVILPPDTFALWLDPALQDPGAITGLLRRYPPEAMVAFPVRTLVNNPAVDDPRCIEPAA